MFTTVEEYIKAMLDGRKFESSIGTTKYYSKQDREFKFRTSGGEYTKDSFVDFNSVGEVFDIWYDDPNNKGKWCWFWDMCTYSRVLGRFEEYHESSAFQFCCSNYKQYYNAKLLTEEEVEVITKASPELVL